MRTFIAIELPEEIKKQLGDIQERLKESGADVKWVPPRNIHLTLKFLGEINDSQLEKTRQIMETCAGNQAHFQASISSLGVFPEINFPRIIWAGIDKGDKETKEMAGSLEEKLQQIGIPAEDRPFSSHITIGRMKSQIKKERLIKNLKALADNPVCGENMEFSVKSITLFKSTLTPGGPLYETLNTANLKIT